MDETAITGNSRVEIQIASTLYHCRIAISSYNDDELRLFFKRLQEEISEMHAGLQQARSRFGRRTNQ